MTQRLSRDHKYQVWITSYPMDATSPATKYDKGYELVGQHDTITEAVQTADENRSYEPVITKLVTYETVVKDVTEAHK